MGTAAAAAPRLVGEAVPVLGGRDEFVALGRSTEAMRQAGGGRDEIISGVPVAEVDRRSGGPAAEPTPWPEAVRVLANAERYWLSTVGADGRPHVIPLAGVWQDDALHFCASLEEQDARLLELQPHVAVTTGRNIWARGLDVVVEGVARRVSETGALQRVADACEAKYGSGWPVDVGERVFRAGADAAAVFRVDAEKVIAFAKRPHPPTRFRFTGR